MEDLMNHIYKKFALAIIMAAIMPMQAHGYAASFNAALSCATAWVKNACGSALTSSYASAKKYAGPALIGMSAIATFACAADYAASKAELDLLNKMMADLEKQRQEKKLSPCEQKYKSLMPVVLWQDLKKEIQDYDAALQGNKNNASDAHVIAYYESFRVNNETEQLGNASIALLDKRFILLADKRFADQVSSYDESCHQVADYWYQKRKSSIFLKPSFSGSVKAQLEDYLPWPTDIICMRIDQAQDIINRLEKACDECRRHVSIPIYGVLGLRPSIYKYLDQLSAHAQAVKNHLEAIQTTTKALQDRGLSLAMTAEHRNIVKAYHNLRVQVAKMIDQRTKQQRTYFRRMWQTSAVFLGAVAAAAYFKVLN